VEASAQDRTIMKLANGDDFWHSDVSVCMDVCVCVCISVCVKRYGHFVGV